MSLPSNLLTLLFQALRRFSAKCKQLTQRYHNRHLWTQFWRSVCKCASAILTKRRRYLPDQPSVPTPVVGMTTGREEGSHAQILASYLTSNIPFPASLHSASRTSLGSDEGEYSLNVLPPPDDDRRSTWSSYRSNRRSLSGCSITLHSPNDMASQTLEVTRSPVNGSQISLVHPASHFLQSDSVASLGKSGISKYIYPLMPQKFARYKRERLILNTDEVEAVVNPLQDSFSLGALPAGWEQITHPEGTSYFYHSEKRIATDFWIWEPANYVILAGFVETFEDFTRSKHVSQPADAYLMLDINIEDGVNWCGYYYASASSRTLFWLETFDISKYVADVRGTLVATHIKLYLEYAYWYHWDFFPQINPPSQEIYVLVANTINDARTDVQTSHSSTVNYNSQDLREMADIVESATKRRSPNSSWCLGRFMGLITKDRFLNYHGQYAARLNHYQSVYGNKGHERTLLIKVFSPLLFSAPNVHLKSLNELWVDQVTLKARCHGFFVKLNEQWGEHIVHASILLTANVAFLAIPSIDPSNNSATLLAARTSAQIASYLSVISSYASMLVALLLVRNHKAKERPTEDVHVYHEYMCSHHKEKRGFEDLAIIYSLPYAFLTWAMGTFLIAFMLMCFVTSTTTTRSVIGVATFIVVGFIAWCIWMFWEETEVHWRAHIKKMIGEERLERLKQFRCSIGKKKETSESDNGEGQGVEEQRSNPQDGSETVHDAAATNQLGVRRFFSIAMWQGRWPFARLKRKVSNPTSEA